MIYMWFTGVNYYKLAVEKDRDSIFTTITTLLKSGFSQSLMYTNHSLYPIIFVVQKAAWDDRKKYGTEA